MTTGYVYAVRVIESSGNSDLDNAILNTLQQWRFRPRLIYKLVVPVDFTGPVAHLGAR
ncbi:MAG TPA: TonB family protein [Chthoniobacterales bacterium]|nr:TonB family protein [Chthoniobacterales bacterium]